jgi:FolB domain-containing protein
MSRIRIVDLEVFYCIGVTDEERAKPQRLLLTVDMTYDFTSAALTDRLERTINYQTVADELLRFGENRNWKLLEKLVTNIADVLMAEHKPQVIVVEAKKFSLPNARYVSVSLSRNRGQ